MSENYDVLEDQIGDAGGEKTLGKIKHKEILGQQPDLSKEEQESLEKFKQRGAKEREERKEAKISQGWIPIDKSELGDRAAFYPASYQFFVRPATVRAIKNWTAVDETNSADVNNVLNEIIKTSIKVDDNGVSQGWGKINSWDRFWFVLKVREATFTKGESKVEFEDKCSECGEKLTYELTSSSLFFDIPDQELIEKYWDGTCWEIDPKEYDVQHDPIKLYNPTCQKDDAIIRWAQAIAQQQRTVDQTFIKFLIWLMPKPMKDEMLDNQITKIQKEFDSWSPEFYLFMEDVINNLSCNPSDKISATCPHCDRRTVSTVQFPNGIKDLFKVRTNFKKFGTR